MRIVKPSVELIHYTRDPERVIERMGRICYQSQHRVKPCLSCGGSARSIDPNVACLACGGTGTDITSAIAFVKMVIANGHESVIEHASAGFSIVTDRGVTHEIVRHRLASYSQESTRCCDYNGERFGCELTFVEPPGLSTEPREGVFGGPPLPSCRELWFAGIRMSEQTYQQLRQKAVRPEIARSVLPNSLKSEIGMTANFREWRHFLRLRTSPKAHPQMREIAEMIRAELLKISPVCFEDIP
jgi:thymidylate synthase (FAD)